MNNKDYFYPNSSDEENPTTPTLARPMLTAEQELRVLEQRSKMMRKGKRHSQCTGRQNPVAEAIFEEKKKESKTSSPSTVQVPQVQAIEPLRKKRNSHSAVAENKRKRKFLILTTSGKRLVQALFLSIRQKMDEDFETMIEPDNYNDLAIETVNSEPA